MNWELPDVQAGFRKGRGIRDQITNIRWIIEKARELQRNICFIDSPKVFDSGSQQTVENSERDGIPDHLTCLLWNLMQIKKQQLEPYMEQLTGSKLGKMYNKAVIITLLI